MQRLRVKFGRDDGLKFISHLDLMRMWERALRRSGIEMAYSEGFNPHPRLSLAAPLAVGVTSEAELLDVYLAGEVSPHWFLSAVKRQLPAGIDVLAVHQVPLNLPSLQSAVRFAAYRVVLQKEASVPDVREAVEGLLSLESLPWQHQRDTGKRSYDLRPLIEYIAIGADENGTVALEMKLRCDSRGAGRPEQVARALGFSAHPISMRRTGLVLSSLKQTV